MDWTSLVAAVGACVFAYSIAPWLTRNTVWRVLWLSAVCGLVVASIRYQHPPATSLVGAAGSMGTMIRAFKAAQEQRNHPA